MEPQKSSRSHTANWIRNHFIKRECVCVCPTSKDSNKCGCGRYLASHYYFEEEVEGGHDNPGLRWSISKCTGTFPTDEFGTLAYQGIHGPNKSHFIRLDFSSEPAEIYRLLTEVWGLEPPKLIITVHGGTNNFELPSNLTKALRKGLLKAAKTTNAWIITSGVRMGVVKHVVSAIIESFSDRKQKFTVIGIVPWGVLKRSEDMINCGGACIPYYPQQSSSSGSTATIPSVGGKSRMVTLCENHTCFLMVDNGTVGRSGAEFFLRRRFEDFLKQQPLGSHASSRRMPLVCLVLGGGKSTIQSVLYYITSQPPVPVVICAGSGRAADILAFAHSRQGSVDRESSEQNEQFRRQLLRVIEESFGVHEAEAQKIFKTVLLCSKFLNLASVFSCDKDESRSSDDHENELDCVILNTLLNGQNLTPVDRLGLLLTWNRDDMAREIFERGNHEWPEGSLNQAMMYALISDRVEFVDLLFHNGMAMDRFLTISRLEELYNTDRGPLNTLKFILQDVVKDPGPNYKYKLPHIGLIIEKLMGSGYRASYTKQDFRRRYKFYFTQFSKRHQPQQNQKTKNVFLNNYNDRTSGEPGARRFTFSQNTAAGKLSHFQYPFHELFLWAVLTKRHAMAMCMWRHGEEPLAKALVGYKLNKALGKEAEEDYLEIEVCQQFKNNANEFKTLAYDLLERCYQTDDDLTLQLLTYELKQWSRKTCLSLAVLANFKKFVAHPSCQMLLADLWLGGLRVRKKAHIKVILSVLLPPLIFFLQFKTQEQLLLQAQTAEEFHENRPDMNPDEELYSSDSSSGDEDDDEEEEDGGASGSREPSTDLGDVEAKLSTASCGHPHRSSPADPPSRSVRLNSVCSTSVRGTRKITKPHRFLAAGAQPVWFSASSRALLPSSENSSNDQNHNQKWCGDLNCCSPSAINNSTSSKKMCYLKPGRRKSSMSATKTSLCNHSEAFEFMHLNNCMTPRHSSDVAMATESESNTPLVAHRRFFPSNGLRHSKTHHTISTSDYKQFSKAAHLDGSDLYAFQTLLPGQSLDYRRVSLKQNQQLSLKKKIREFYQAPIACFWSFVIGYLFFLGAFTYTVLVRTQVNYLEWPEVYVVAFILTFSLDQIRRVLLQEPKGLYSKWKVYSQSTWDVFSCLACGMFLIGLFLRINSDPKTVAVGRVLYCCNIVFWYMRVLHLLTVSSLLGPYITMYGKMVVKMFLLSNILTVVLTSFGIFRQSILYPHLDWSWTLLRNIVYKPYFMLYGELYANEIDECNDNGVLCEPGHFLVPLVMTIYLLLSIIVFVNMMIAAFNYVFLEVNSQSQVIWQFQRLEQVMEYEQQPFLPPPFIFVVHIYLICKYVYRRIYKKDKIYRFEHSLKLYLSQSELDKLNDFERECLEDMHTKKQAENLNSTDERVKQITEKLEAMSQKMDLLYDRCNSNRFLMLLLQDRLDHHSFHEQGGQKMDGRFSPGAGGYSSGGGGFSAPSGGLHSSASAHDLRQTASAHWSAHGGRMGRNDHSAVPTMTPATSTHFSLRGHKRRSLCDVVQSLKKQSTATAATSGVATDDEEQRLDNGGISISVAPGEPGGQGMSRSVTWTNVAGQEGVGGPSPDEEKYKTATETTPFLDRIGPDDPKMTPTSGVGVSMEAGSGDEMAPMLLTRSGTEQSLNSGILLNVSAKNKHNE